MDASATSYIKILLDVVVAVVITAVLFLIARRARKEQTFVGFKARSYDEKYAGYSLLAIGIIIILVSIYELLLILEGGYFSQTPFGLSDITVGVGDQVTTIISGQVLGLVFGISFWLMIFGYGGRKLASLGLDMLKGRKVKLRRTLEKT
jgi:hypothetical protein